MKNKKKLLASAISNKIYLALAKEVEVEKYIVIGEKEDYTDEVINAMFQHMFYLAEETGFYEYEYPDKGKLQFIRSKDEAE